MSRSNPNTLAQNPSTRWCEWNGEKGIVFFYDKESKTKKEIAIPFSFLVLDILSTVKGWNDEAQKGIYSNEVRSTMEEQFAVKIFDVSKPIAEGFYREIKDKVRANGGHFVSSVYIAYKNDEGVLSIGNLQLKGAALNAWVEFSGKKRKDIESKSIVISGKVQGKKGAVTFFTPAFQFKETTPETNLSAIELDKVLQEYLIQYLKRPKKNIADEIINETTPGTFANESITNGNGETLVLDEGGSDLPF